MIMLIILIKNGIIMNNIDHSSTTSVNSCLTNHLNDENKTNQPTPKSQTLKIIKYKISLAYNIILNTFSKKNHPWFNSIIDNKLTLGAIPLKNKGHLEEISKHGVTAILTTLEDFEIQKKTFYSNPITGKDWEARKVDHKIIDTPDFKPVALKKIEEGVEWLTKKINAGNHVYVHCKAGRGRSATIVIAYVLKHWEKHGIKQHSVEEAIAYVKARRPVINMNAQQTKALHHYAAYLQQSHAKLI